VWPIGELGLVASSVAVASFSYMKTQFPFKGPREFLTNHQTKTYLLSGFLGIMGSTPYMLRTLFKSSYCIDYEKYHKTTSALPNQDLSLISHLKYKLEHQNSYVSLKGCSNDREIDVLKMPMLLDEEYRGNLITLSFCETPSKTMDTPSSIEHPQGDQLIRVCIEEQKIVIKKNQEFSLESNYALPLSFHIGQQIKNICSNEHVICPEQLSGAISFPDSGSEICSH